MQLDDILRRVESRLLELGLSAAKASRLAAHPEAIRNLKRAVKDGKRRGVSTATLSALAPVLKVTPGWLLTGSNGVGNSAENSAEEIAVEAVSNESLDPAETISILTWLFQEMENAPEPEARIFATTVVKVIHMRRDRSGALVSDREKRRLIALAIEIFQSKEP
jgi:hypothetical protein